MQAATTIRFIEPSVAKSRLIVSRSRGFSRTGRVTVPPFVAACDYFDVQPTRVLFINDEPGNCRGAKAVGMTAGHASDIAAQQLARQRLALAD